MVAVPESGPRVVKKYGNRRLYDTRDSRYINLDDLVELFATDEEVRVVDAATGEDLTQRTLTQAILSEEGRGKRPLLPKQLLQALLRYRRGPKRADFEKHIEQAVSSFPRSRRR